MIKKVLITFAKPGIKIDRKDQWDDIFNAVDTASVNLRSRYKVLVTSLEQTKHDQYILELNIPDEMASGFSIGNHLRGISSYLLSKSSRKDIYKANKIGNRLLQYVEIDTDNERSTAWAEWKCNIRRLMEK